MIWKTTMHADSDMAKGLVATEYFPTYEAARARIEETLKMGGVIYYGRIWEGPVPCETLYWNGEKVITYNVMGPLSRERAALLYLDERADVFDFEDESAAFIN